MHISVGFSLSLVALTQAHFQLQYPPPRGVFVEDNEPNFCDGYNTPASTRIEFPLTGGFFSLNSEHPSWTAGVLISSAEDPTSFNNFTQIVPFAKLTGEGEYCLALDLSSGFNGTSFKDSQNVTIQVVFDGGDGQLYQASCADLTLKSGFTIASDVPCTNATGPNNGRPTATSPGTSATGSSGAASPTKSSSASDLPAGALAFALGPLLAAILSRVL